MISWIQRYFQKHFKTVFAILLAVTIISFILTIGASPGIGRGDRRVVEREFFGYNLSLADDYQKLMGDARLSATLQTGMMGGIDDEQLRPFAYHRAAALYLASQWHIPKATTDEIKAEIPKLRMFAGQDGEFDPKAYNNFRDSLRGSAGGASQADFARVIGDDIRVDKVNKLIAGPGYVLARDVKTQLERTDTTWTLSTATADYAAFKPDIRPTDAELLKYFEDNSFRYEIPPRVVASYLDFPSTQFLRDVKVTDVEVRAFYDANPARFPKPPEVKPADGKTPPKSTPDADFAAVKLQVSAELQLERAQKLALKAASDLALAMFEAKVNSGPAIDAFLATRKISAKPLAPFTREGGPAELGHSPEIAEEAFKLRNDHSVSDALPSSTGAVVLLWKDLEPAHKPQFSEARAKVAADYIENEKQKRFIALGRTGKTDIEARIKAGDTFEKAVASAATATGLKIEAKTLAPFSLRNRPQDVDYSILSVLDRLNKGDVSDMLFNANKGIFVYAQDKKRPDLNESSARYMETRNQLATYSAQTDANAILSELVDREEKRNDLKSE